MHAALPAPLIRASLESTGRLLVERERVAQAVEVEVAVLDLHSGDGWHSAAHGSLEPTRRGMPEDLSWVVTYSAQRDTHRRAGLS